MLIGISGKIGSGKTTFASLLFKKLIEHKQEVTIRNFADKLKSCCHVITGHYGYTQEDKNTFLPEFNMTVGEFLQGFGTKLREHFYDKIWVTPTISNLKENTTYIIGDCRFPNEADAIKDADGIVIRLEGDPLNVRKDSTRDMSHPSEIALDNYTRFDYVYNNEQGLDKLELFAEKISKLLIPQIVI